MSDMNAEQLQNAVKLFNKDWALLGAGTPEHFNMMTVSWGGLGELWGKAVVTVYVRPQRYTLGFLDKNDFFTLSFFDGKYRPMLSDMGKRSGRDICKRTESGLTPRPGKTGAITFCESSLTIECRKLYRGEFRMEEFLDTNILNEHYPNNDLHKIFIGEIVHIEKAD